MHSLVRHYILSTADDVLTEQAIRKWFDDAHVAKGKSVFLGQMQRMVDWLDVAEEECVEVQKEVA